MPVIGRLFYEIGGDTDRLQAEINKASTEIAKIKPRDPLLDLIPTDKDIRAAERRSAEFTRMVSDWGKEAVSIGEDP